MTEKIMVTGGAGFIGSNLAKRLIDDKKEIRILDNLSSGSLQNLLDLGVTQKVEKVDFMDYEATKKALKGVDTVYHLAADIGNVVYLHGSNAKELAAMQYNLILDTNVLRACVENNVKCVIYASSVSVYSYKQQLTGAAVFKEEDADTNVDPEGGYGWAKYIAEKQLQLSNMKYGIARIFHAYGPCIDVSDSKAQVIAASIKKTFKYPKEPYINWGDGTQKRCFVYIDDIVDAIMKMRAYIEEHNSLVVNMGSIEEVTIRELVQEIIKISGKKITVKYDTTFPTGANSRKPDLARAMKTIGWKPTTPLHVGLKKTYEWEKKRLGYT